MISLCGSGLMVGAMLLMKLARCIVIVLRLKDGTLIGVGLMLNNY